MKQLLYIFTLSLLFNCSKEPTINIPTNNGLKELVFANTYGGSKNDVTQSIVKTANGGYAILGYTQSKDGDIQNKNNESFDFWLMKFSSENNLLWSKTYGGTDDDRGFDIIETSDGGFALLGYSSSSDIDVSQNAGSKDFWIVKIDVIGNITWQKSYGFAGLDEGKTLIQTNDNGYLITGVLDVTASGGQGNSRNSQRHAGGDVWAIKLSSTGNKEWSKFYGGSFTDTPLGIVNTADNGFIIAASSDSNDVDISNNKGSYDFWILKISAIGTLVWEKSFGGSEIDEARAITSTNDGNFIIVGDTRSNDKDVTFNNGVADLWMLKISPEGNLIWEKTIGASSFDVARSITKTNNNGFLITGSSRSSDGGFNNNGQNDGWVLNVDESGIVKWQKIIGGSEIDFLYDAVELNNNTIIAVGESNSDNGDITSNKGFSDALIVKIK